MTLTQIKRVLSQRELHANKRLGQNLLYDPNMIRRILDQISIARKGKVVEVGPGLGALTEGLLGKSAEVWGIEIDRGFAQFLGDRFKDQPHFHLVHGDILNWEPQAEKFVLVGNIPYQISSPLMEWIVNYRERISEAYLTVQSEFAQRMIARPGTHRASSLSCLMRIYAEPRVLFRIPRTVFYPAPDVDSAFVHLKILKRAVVQVKDEGFLRRLIRKGFSHRRKTLVNVLLKELGLPRHRIVETLEQLRLSADIRAERLTLQQWGELSDRLR